MKGISREVYDVEFRKILHKIFIQLGKSIYFILQNCIFLIQNRKALNI